MMSFTVSSATPPQPSGVPAQDCDNECVGRAQASVLRVRDAMLTTPKTVGADATAGDLRALFANSHVRTALLVDGSRFVGAVSRDQLDDRVSDERPAALLADCDVPTTQPDTPLNDALTVLDGRDERRLVVLDPDGERLRGLLCLTSDRSGFCRS